MRSFFKDFAAISLIFGGVVLTTTPYLPAQETLAATQAAMVNELPDAPQPVDGIAGSTSQLNATEDQVSAPVEQNIDRKTADEQIKAQEQQRVLGVVPTFNVTYLGNATVSMTAKQKFGLALHTVTDPVAFVMPFVVAGYHEALDDDQGFPWGVKGLGERAGAAYLDAFDGIILGNAVLPSILHQDPRYYRLGRGSITRRLSYAAATSFICKHDKTGRWEPNYSNVAGNIASGAISNLYYPSNDGGAGLAISNGMIVTAEGALGAVFDEFWPDISRKLFHKDPSNGRDTRLKTPDEANKEP